MVGHTTMDSVHACSRCLPVAAPCVFLCHGDRPVMSVWRVQVVNGLLARLYPEHIRERLHEMQHSVLPPVPEQACALLNASGRKMSLARVWCSVMGLRLSSDSAAMLFCVALLMPGSVQVISVLQEAAGLPGAPLDGHTPPSTNIQHTSLSSTDPRPSSDGAPNSMCQLDISNISSAPDVLLKHFSASQSSDSPTAGGQHVGVQHAERMRAAQAADSAEVDCGAGAEEGGLPVSCEHAAGSAQAGDWRGASGGEEAAAWKPGGACSGVYAPALVLEGATVLLTGLSLLTALCRRAAMPPCMPIQHQACLSIPRGCTASFGAPGHIDSDWMAVVISWCRLGQAATESKADCAGWPCLPVLSPTLAREAL